MSTEKDRRMETTRQKFFEESRFDPYKQRFGLFSFPGITAVGDSTYNQAKTARKNTDGSVLTAPRNFLTAGTKSGKNIDAYFSEPLFHSVGDKFIDKEKPQRKEQEKAGKMVKVHGCAWKTGAKSTTGLFSNYEYMPQSSERKKRPFDTSTSLRNFYTGKPKKGQGTTTPGVTFGEYPEYMSDPYNRKTALEREERKKQKEKMQEAPFKSTAYGRQNFFDDKQTFGGDFTFSNKKRPSTHTGIRHDRAFFPSNPSKKGGTIGSYPEFIPNPPSQTQRKEKEDKEPWKAVSLPKTVHTPSIVSNRRNLK